MHSESIICIPLIFTTSVSRFDNVGWAADILRRGIYYIQVSSAILFRPSFWICCTYAVHRGGTPPPPDERESVNFYSAGAPGTRATSIMFIKVDHGFRGGLVVC
eukprot:GEMP01086058.1.p1 GENE.GEMP01086058.1~~GEMP01086058.1.p1  ORF type:complete len:104 (-),score=10.53 GEMP01086058.1:42-353(-)